MKKILLILVILAATLGAGFYIYQKSKSAPNDEELVSAATPPHEPEPPRPEKDTPAPMEEPAPHEAPAPEHADKGRVKASSGHFEMSHNSQAEVDPQDNPGYGKAREKRLWQIFNSDKDLVRSVKVKRIHCRVDTCTVEAESKDGDADRFQSLMYALIKQYAWLGNKIDVTTPEDNPKVARYVYFQETPK